MTMPTPEHAERRAQHIVEIARAFVADPNDDEKRLEFCRATFNLDWLAAAIVVLADAESTTEGAS
jgi:hypothetical protein